MSTTNFNPEQLAKEVEQSGNGIPPVDKWQPEFCGDIDMRIARDGTWFYQGTPITRPAMVKMFSRVLWFEEGEYFLKTPVEKVGIEVEDAPFLVTELEIVEAQNSSEAKGAVELHFTTLTGDRIIAGSEHPIWVDVKSNGEPSPYIRVRFGMPGLLSRSVFYQLVDLADEIETDGMIQLVVHSQGETFSLGSL